MQALSKVMLANVVQKLWYAAPDGERVLEMCFDF